MDYGQNLRDWCAICTHANLFMRISDFTIAYDWPL